MRPHQRQVQVLRQRPPAADHGWHAKLERVPAAYLAAEGFERQLEDELRLAGIGLLGAHGRLLLADAPPIDLAWAANIWLQPQLLPIDSIGDAAGKLRALQRNWQSYAPLHHRRASLIGERLPHVGAKPLRFPSPPPAAALGSWTLLAPDHVLASARCSSAFANGEVAFVEDRTAPPNRAYLKLWEAFTRIGAHPKPGELCLDLGASPGGWTWVLASLGAEAIAVDKAPLDPRIAAMSGVRWQQGSAFALEPAKSAPVDWLLSDIACYPRRLLTLVHRWLDSGKVRNFVCTLKFQAETDHATAAEFRAIPGSRLFHLHNNKHELTWVRLS